MPFDKVETLVDFPAQERAVLEFWERTQAFEKLRAQNRGKPKWSFLDGPITANNPMGVHHAWGRTYKDLYQRYFAMTGHEERYQNGFDCQGLWVEVEVEKELGLRSKRDIENLVPNDSFASIDLFVQKCKQRVDKYAKRQTEQSIRLGYWMDWDRDGDWDKPPDQRRSYFTMSEENNYTIWTFLKKCHERGLIYRGYDAMPWCPRCAVGLSQMEMHEGYQMVAHRAVFVRFPLRDRPGENLLVWTTTPWTLTSNVAAAVNPYLTYVAVKHHDQVYYVAKGALTAHRLEEEFKQKEYKAFQRLKTLEQIFKEKGGYEVVGELSGAAMVGWTYDGPFDELPAQKHPGGYPPNTADVVLKQGWAAPESARAIHRVIAWDAVGAVEGTGIVHIAPGCGKEDFQLGKDNRLVPVAPLDEYGVFVTGFGPLEGKSALDHTTTDVILDNLNGKGVLLAVEKYPHSYPHCWRCKTELLFRLVDEWFINMSWRDEIMRVTEQATFVPESINGKARELDWLRNMGDWMISKKRFWGLALPVWVCESCNAFDVIGSRNELKERAVAGWDTFEGHTPHRPWVDQVTIRCQACGGTSRRILDVGNPWLDAGIVPYSTMKYNTDRAYWEKWFPADFITESFPGQFRNWFYSILAMSTMMTERVPFEALLGHGLVRDEKGKEMHKTAGNAIPFEGAADEGYWLAERELRPKETAEAALKSPLPEGALELKVGEIEEKGKKVPALLAKYPPMGADVLRWLYCRHNPALNINFGPHPANEVRSRFFLKLWNTYGPFFCNYARLDGFDPQAPQVPVKERPDIDRWILSDLQKLVELTNESFREFNVMAFCLEAERFVDEKLSNWYVRRNRRRFWKSEKEADKLAAYQTLYEALLTLTKLLAPVIPFLTETMYQNLTQGVAGRAESVHLCPYPQVNEGLIDEQLSADTKALFDLVTLGSAARNSVKLKVRQPLAEMKVTGNEGVKRAIDRFGSLLEEELNIGSVVFVSAEGLRSLVKLVLEADPKILGPIFGKNLQAINKELEAYAADGKYPPVEQDDCGELHYLLNISGRLERVPRTGVKERRVGPPGWVYVTGDGAEVLLDTRITEKLKFAGMAREVVRHVQQARKDTGLEMEDRITLYLHTDAERLKKAIETHRAYIATETLVGEWSAQPLGEGAYRADVKVDGQPLRIELRRVETAGS
jgi:isoleucyl-tRNA synthetase